MGNKLDVMVLEIGRMWKIPSLGQLIVSVKWRLTYWRATETGDFGELRGHIKYRSLVWRSNVIALGHPVVERLRIHMF